MKVTKEWKRVYFVSLFILIGSVLPFKKAQIIGGISSDDAAHIFLYFVLALFTIKAFGQEKRSFLNSFLYVFFWGFFVELVQFFVPYRCFDITDIAINSLGALLGIGLYGIIHFPSKCKRS